MQRVGELMPAATRLMTTPGRFRFNLTPQDALDLIAAFYAAEVRRRQRQFVPDEYTTENLSKLADFITSPVPKFGLMLCGTVGNGKTTLMKAFQRCIFYLDAQHHFEFLDDKEYGQRFKPEMRIVDVRDILRYAKTSADDYDNLRSYRMLGIDDLGKEPAEVLDYGNVLSPVIDLIEHRYDKQLFTFITSNLTPKEIREKYGERIADRFNEMLGVIVFRNRTYRPE